MSQGASEVISLLLLLFFVLIGPMACAARTQPVPSEEDRGSEHPQDRVARLRGVRSWACAYDRDADPLRFHSLDLLIVDPDGPPSLTEFRGLTLAYLSLGEVHESRAYFGDLPKLEENPRWPRAHRIDLRNGVWKRKVVQEILPTLDRYDGYLLDTVDTVVVTHQETEMVDLIRAIRKASPDKLLVANNPGTLLKRIEVDAIMAEALFTAYDPEKKGYAKTDRKAAVKTASQYRGRTVLSLEYGTDRALVDYALDCAREYGFIPYVTTVDLREPTTFHRRPK